ncbi:MAG: M48 family metallopeptidase [Pseudochelatococcus sp.]|jgi:predicted metal-dependent hydrolase|uniref:M48 family metallopeptidase n=1 Tax=Pseudochelatococcus sp. TaxID=2020869 RepID=UPI003D8AE4BA
MLTRLFRGRRPPAPDPAPDYVDVAHAGSVFRVRVVRRAGVKRFTLRVSLATGTATMTMPARSDIAAARRFLDAHGDWLAQRMQSVPGRVPFEPGALIPLRDVPHRIVHWSGLRGQASATVDAAGAPIISVTGEAPHVARRVRDFLQAEARRDLSQAVARYTRALGVPARSITLRDTKSRWGSCSAQGRLNFSWRLILAPPLVLDYLAAHEVAHLRELNHSDRFWALTHELCPATPQAEAWLKRHGSLLHRYG